MLPRMDEKALCERLITYDTSAPDGIRAAAGFLKGCLQARDIEAVESEHHGLPVIMAEVGAAGGHTALLHGHIDVVPGRPGQFEPRCEGDRLYGRGAYDMKGALAAMVCALEDMAAQNRVRVRFLCTPDEESEEVEDRSTDVLVQGGLRADFAITGEPTDLHIGVQSKGVLFMRVEVAGTAAHGSTPWEGDNAVLKGLDVFRAIEGLPFARESSELFDRPSINLGRITGGDAINKVPDQCTLDVDVRYLPGQEPDGILDQVGAIPDVEVVRIFSRVPAIVSRTNPYVRALREAVGSSTRGEALGIGRDGSSDAVSFLEAGIPAVEFGPVGGGHHGPEEWVSVQSLRKYRQALCDFVAGLPDRLAIGASGNGSAPGAPSPRELTL